jgi:uncharacterized protein with FMN-binding domain
VELTAALPAVPTAEPAAAPAVAEQVEYKDGTYLGWGRCRHGELQASVLVEGGRITRAEVAQCYTRYPCNYLNVLLPQVVARQSANVDYVSGATESAEAFYDALVDALSKAK